MSKLDKVKENNLSVLKIDKNFHLYIHGNSDMLEESEDEKGNFLKIYYKELY